MSSFLFCIKHICQKICLFFGLRKPQIKVRQEGDDLNDEVGRITMNAWQDIQNIQNIPKQQIKQKSKPKTETKTETKTKTDTKTQITKTLNLLDNEDQLIMMPLSVKLQSPKFQQDTLNIKINKLHEPIQTDVGMDPQPPSLVKQFNINTQSFKINLQPYQNFYQILQKKTKNLEEKLNTNSALIEVINNATSLEIRHAQVGKVNIFIYQFRLPCTYSFYSQMLNDYTLQKKLDSNIDQFKMLQLHANNMRINYLSYKKILIVSPRDFVYLKYSNNVDNQYWDISFSIPWESYPNMIRGEIVLNSCKIIERNEYIDIQVYSQIDMKLSVSAKITRNQAVNQIKKYVDRCDKYVKANYKKELV